MKRSLHNIMIFASIGALFLFGTQYIYAAWSEPTLDPPAGNKTLDTGGGAFERIGSVVRQSDTTDYYADFLFGSPQRVDDGFTEHDERMFFHKDSASFRAGRTTGSQWDTGNLGERSVAFGYDTVASGNYSFAAGYAATSSGQSSFSMGSYTQALGNESIALGRYATARGSYATALGYYAGDTTSDDQSINIGAWTDAGRAAVALGRSADAFAASSTAIGYYADVDASSYSSTAIGPYAAVSDSQYATAMGISVEVAESAHFATAIGKYIYNNVSDSIMLGISSSNDTSLTANPGVFIDSDNNVGIRTSTITSGLTLDVEGSVGATEFCTNDGSYCFNAEVASTTITNIYTDGSGNVGALQFCDEDGLNCFTAADIATLIAGGGGSTGGGSWEFISRTNGSFPCYECSPSGSVAIPDGTKYIVAQLGGQTTEGGSTSWRMQGPAILIMGSKETAVYREGFDSGSSASNFKDVTATVNGNNIDLTTSISGTGGSTGHLTYDFYFYNDGSGGGSAYFGDGSDGDKTYSSNESLSEDLYCEDLTVDAGRALDTNGYRIFCTGTVTVNGTIRNNGQNGGDGGDAQSVSPYNPGTGGTGGVGGAGNTVPGGVGGGNGGNGTDGGTSGGSGGNGVSIIGIGNNGSSGGAGGRIIQPCSYGCNAADVPGGSGGVVTPTRNELKDFVGVYNLFEVIHGAGSPTVNSVYPAAGSGGGTAGGTNCYSGYNCNPLSGGGGGAGGTGGIVSIFASSIVVGPTGRIEANGGDGGNAGNGSMGGQVWGFWSGSGGGAGGNGGAVILVYSALSNNGVIEAVGGVGGVHTNAGGRFESYPASTYANNGTDGSDGSDGSVVLLEM